MFVGHIWHAIFGKDESNEYIPWVGNFSQCVLSGKLCDGFAVLNKIFPHIYYYIYIHISQKENRGKSKFSLCVPETSVNEWNTWVKQQDERRWGNAIGRKWKKRQNQAFLFMLSKIREIVLRLFLCYSNGNALLSEQQPKKFLFLPPHAALHFSVMLHVLLYRTGNLNTRRQPSGNKIKIPFSIHTHARACCVDPLLCKMNFISIIIINVMCWHIMEEV